MPLIDDNLITLKQASSFCPYSADYLNLLARKGKIRAVKIGRDWLVTRPDLVDYLSKQRQESRLRMAQLSKYLNLLL
jgi:excisionase family DNA binding protein